MARCEAELLQMSGPRELSHILWYNDDTIVDPDGLAQVCCLSNKFPSSIVVGAICGHHSQAMTYSGMNRSGRHPLAYTRVEPSGLPQAVDTFNGNIVLVPIRVSQNWVELMGISPIPSQTWTTG